MLKLMKILHNLWTQGTRSSKHTRLRMQANVSTIRLSLALSRLSTNSQYTLEFRENPVITPLDIHKRIISLMSKNHAIDITTGALD